MRLYTVSIFLNLAAYIFLLITVSFVPLYAKNILNPDLKVIFLV